MSEVSKEDMMGFAASAERLAHAIETMPAAGSSTGNATITINAGGWGVMVCLALFAFMAGLTIPLYLQQRDQQRQIDDLNHYLNAIYQQAPELKPKEQ